MKEYIVETIGPEGHVFLTVIQAKNLHDAIESKTNDTSIGQGRVTGITMGTKLPKDPGNPLWGNVIMNIEKVPPLPTRPKYRLITR